MKISALKIVSILALASEILADSWHVYSEDELIVIACKAGLEATAKWCSGKTKNYKCACKNPGELASWVNCVHGYSDNIEKAEEIMIDYCKEANVTMTTEKLAKAYKNATANTVDITNVTSFNKTAIIDYPITGGKLPKKFEGYYHGYKHRYGNLDTSHYLGIGAVSAWGALMIVCGLANWTQRLAPSVAQKFNGKAINLWRKYVTSPALFNKYHVQNFGIFGYMPDRFESIILVIFLIFSGLANGIIGFSYYKGDLVFTNASQGISRYIGDRSAIVASYELPLLFIFAGRNNILQALTRWKYSRFLTFHKGIARLVFAQLVIHSIAMTIQSVAVGKWTSRLATEWFRVGIASTVLGGVAVGLASYTVRRYYYEFFIISHIALIANFLWTAWIHAESQEYENFYIACAAVWCFDRFIRIVRLCLFGIRTAKCEVLSTEGTIKLSVPFPKSFWKPYPGAHGFVHFITPTTFWQSHPFTLIESVTDKDHIHFYCKVKGGITKVMHNKIISEGKNTFDIKVMVEGPYGEQSPYYHYDKAVLVAGGNGIPGPFSHALDLVTKNVKTEVKLYWAVREYNVLNWFREELNQFKGTKCKPIIYISNTDSQISDVDFSSTDSSADMSSSDEKDSTKNEKTQLVSLEQLKEAFDFIEFRTGRINVEQLVADEIRESTGTIAFGACAHPNMVDEFRAVVSKSYNDSSKKIDYFEEMQAW
ncbi:hypothetical protein CANARDRAFT_29930 [[Candida] arabinofermentans NRRL YB-2248]|uniref:ferric-chelate reductase (NADPH) n=1 Tax=[Candida] arabinofermentans NRRL YB-2248 TaxID=983967 RepID=A0A1E4SVG7_9ASCO|nr:hypothetical protein CANARDRAFT_29930 [[Candida] arabinofermentans NRRL YB-2248]